MPNADEDAKLTTADEVRKYQSSAVSLDMIQVAGLRTSFYWPLTLDQMGDGRTGPAVDNAKFLKRQEEWLLSDKSPWQSVTDGLLHLPIPDATDYNSDLSKPSPRNEAMADAYGEYTYFHDFVQRALFGKTGREDAGPFRLFQRSDVASVDVELKGWGAPRRFAVERVNLYLLSHGAAVLVLQCYTEPSAGLTLRHILGFNDCMRRSHFPFFEVDEKTDTIQSMGLPVSVIWNLLDGKKWPFYPDLDGVDQNEGDYASSAEPPRPIRTATPFSKLIGTTPKERRSLPAAHWRWLLNGGETLVERFPIRHEREGYLWRHFSDDRLPILSTVILADRSDYFAMSDGHWMRLAFVEPPGDDPFPYAEEFLRQTFAQHCYDRYHHKERAKADPPVRYLMCDYAMQAVTYREGNGYSATIEMHMQRHYYQIFLLQVIDKAVLLGLSSRITRAVERFDPSNRGEGETLLSADLQNIQRDFLTYVHRFRFTGVSGQLQAGEIYAQLRGLMRLETLFADIRTELETAINFLSTRESEVLGREAHRATAAAERLNIIASLGVVIALVLGFFSMNIVTDKGLIERLFGRPQPVRWWDGLLGAGQSLPEWPAHFIALGIGFVTVSLISLGLSYLIAAQGNAKQPEVRPAEKFVRASLKVIAGLGIALAAFGLYFR